MKNCGRCNVRKHRDITGSDKYVTLYISLRFGSLGKMRIKSSEPKDNSGRSGKGLITSLGLKAKERQKKHKKARHAIGNISKKDLSNIIRDFEKLPYKIIMKGGGPNMILLTVTLHSKTSCEVYDESSCHQLARLTFKNGNDWYKTDSVLAHFFTDERKL